MAILSSLAPSDPFGSLPELRKLNSTQYEVGSLGAKGCSPYVGGGQLCSARGGSRWGPEGAGQDSLACFVL
jgi:hypothetical protein